MAVQVVLLAQVQVVFRCTQGTLIHNCNLRRKLRAVPFMVNTRTLTVIIITVALLDLVQVGPLVRLRDRMSPPTDQSSTPPWRRCRIVLLLT